MEANTKIKLTVGVVIIIATTYFIARSVVKKKGFTHNKTASKLFGVVFLDPMYKSIKHRDDNKKESEQENKETADGIVFR